MLAQARRIAASTTVQRVVRGRQTRLAQACIAVQAAFRGYAARLQLIRRMFEECSNLPAEACKFPKHVMRSDRSVANSVHRKLSHLVDDVADTSPEWFQTDASLMPAFTQPGQVNIDCV